MSFIGFILAVVVAYFLGKAAGAAECDGRSLFYIGSDSRKSKRAVIGVLLRKPGRN